MNTLEKKMLLTIAENLKKVVDIPSNVTSLDGVISWIRKMKAVIHSNIEMINTIAHNQDEDEDANNKGVSL